MKRLAPCRQETTISPQEKEELLSDLFDNANDLIQCVDAKGHVIYANNQWKKKLGYKDQDLAHITLKDIIKKEHLPYCMERFKDIKNGKALKNFETIFVSKKGKEVPVSGNINAKIRDGKFTYSRGIFRDLTEQRKTEQHLIISNIKLLTAKQELAQLNKELEKKVKDRTQKLEEAYKKLKELDKIKDEFLSNISHELRTPMTTLRSYNRLLATEAFGPITPEQKEALDIMLASTDEQIHLINNILQVSRYEAGKAQIHFRETDLNAIIIDVIKEFIPAINELKGNISLKQYDHHAAASVDDEKIKEAIRNFISNAIKYRHKQRPPKISINIKKNNEYYVIAVQDNGIGISKENLSHIFDKFYQVDQTITREVEGTGLGLSIVEHIAKVHKGSIHARSTPGKGSTFILTLPTGKQQGFYAQGPHNNTP